MTEAGWHQDPQDPTKLRYWDGTAWTENVHQPTGPPPQAKNRTGLIIGLVVAAFAAFVLLPAVAIVAVSFLGTSAQTKFSTIGTAVGTASAPTSPPTTAVDPGPFTVVVRAVQALEANPCTPGAIPSVDGTLCARTGPPSIPLKGLAGAVPAGDTWNVEVRFKPETSAALDRLTADCSPTPKGACTLGRIAIVRIGRTETVVTSPLLSTASFKGHAVFTGFPEAKAKSLADLINNTK